VFRLNGGIFYARTPGLNFASIRSTIANFCCS
jgi:hypothetical protein